MRNLFSDGRFEEEHIRCSKCGWEGRGDDTNIIDFYGLSKVKEVHCPSCDSYIGGLSRADYKTVSRVEREYGDDSLSNQFG